MVVISLEMLDMYSDVSTMCTLALRRHDSANYMKSLASLRDFNTAKSLCIVCLKNEFNLIVQMDL